MVKEGALYRLGGIHRVRAWLVEPVSQVSRTITIRKCSLVPSA